MSSIIIIDDDKALCRSLEIQLTAEKHSVKTAGTGAEGLDLIRDHAPDVVLLDIKLPDKNGLEILETVLELNSDLPVVMITGQQDMQTTIDAMRAGAFDYLRKPFGMDDVTLILEKISRYKPVIKNSKFALPDKDNEIIGTDKKIVDVVKQIGLLSRTRVDVLVTGESGTGKELVAKTLHEVSCPGKPFVAINCSAIVPTLLETELFGHEKGAFTGADTRVIGKLEHAGEGTVFLDEIGDMSMNLQSKLLRVLQEKVFERVGSVHKIKYNARTIAATNKDPELMVKEGTFRQDLYFRLNVSRIHVPPVRERREDIPLLAEYFVRKIAREMHSRVNALEHEAVMKLQSYDWPGNARELQNVITRAVSLARRNVISADDLELTFKTSEGYPAENTEIKPLKEIEKQYILKILHSNGWNITQTAKQLEISPTTLRKKIRDYKLEK